MIEVIDAGTAEFAETAQLQRELVDEVGQGRRQGAIVCVRHRPVITVGRGGSRRNVLASERALHSEGIAVIDVDRGGDVTYHGPGQLTVYPIFDLGRLRRDLHWYLRQLERCVIETLREFGIGAQASAGRTGVWVGERKIASIGIGVRRWISFHGLTVNVAQADCGNFSLIRPCGMDIAMTSVEGELGRAVGHDEIAAPLCARLRRMYDENCAA